MQDILKRYQQDQSRYERVVGQIIRTWPRGGVHIDCGAHAGLHTAPMLDRSDVRRVYAVEAIERLCDRLNRLFPDDPSARARLRALHDELADKVDDVLLAALAAAAAGG